MMTQRQTIGIRQQRACPRVVPTANVPPVRLGTGQRLQAAQTSLADVDTRQKVPETLDEAYTLAKRFNTSFKNTQYKEYAYKIKRVEGEIPLGLKGTFLRNGPGLFEVGGKPLPHPFDGDGMVCSLSFDGEGNAFFCNKYVRTPAFLAERRTGKSQYRSAFNRGVPEGSGMTINLPFVGPVQFVNPLDMQVKDAANTNVLRWAGKTLALFERGPPHRLTRTLDTEGPDYLKNSMVGKYMAAHLRITQEPDGANRVVMFSTNEKGNDLDICFYEYDQDFNLLHRTVTPIAGAAFGFYHDAAVSENFYIIIENPVKMDFWKFITQVPSGKASIAECLGFQDTQPARLHLIPRPGRGTPHGTGLRTYDIPGQTFFTFHHGNAYELERDGSATPSNPGRMGKYLVLDSHSAGHVDFSTNVETADERYYGNPTKRVEPSRIVVDLEGPVNASSVRRSVMVHRSGEFPIVAPSKAGRAHRHMYAIASPITGKTFFGPNQAIIKFTIDPVNGVLRPFDQSAVQEEMWMPPSRYQFPGEPAFVPRNPEEGTGPREEDDGWIMSWLYDTEREESCVVILDAQHLSAGPVATVYLDNHHVPAGLHGMWTPEYLGPAPGTPDQQPYDIRNGV